MCLGSKKGTNILKSTLPLRKQHSTQESMQSPEKRWQMVAGKEKRAQKTVKTKTRHYLTLLQVSAASAQESVNDRGQDRLAPLLDCPNYVFHN